VFRVVLPIPVRLLGPGIILRVSASRFCTGACLNKRIDGIRQERYNTHLSDEKTDLAPDNLQSQLGMEV